MAKAGAKHTQNKLNKGPGMPEWQDVMAALEKESPRGQILLLAICCEAGLKDLVTAVAVRPELAEPLTNQRSSFGTLLSIAHAFGLISDNLANALKEINRLRNAIAHTALAVSNPFEHDEVRNITLRIPFRLKRGKSKTAREVRDLFVIAALETLSHLALSIKSARRYTAPANSQPVIDMVLEPKILKEVIGAFARELPKVLDGLPNPE